MLRQMLHACTHWLQPPTHCLLCLTRTDTSLPLCTGCENDLPWLGERCRCCALPLISSQALCGRCIQRKPHFTRVEAPWRYDFPIDSLLNRFKHQAQWPYGRLLSELLVRHLQHAYGEGLTQPSALIPVPLAGKRLRRRGFNQAELIARQLVRQLGIPCCNHWLQRTLDTPAQQGLDARARRRNLRRAFMLDPAADVRRHHLALVDDVVTTGATADRLAKLLLDHGAAQVDVYCLARTPAPNS